MFRKLLTAVAVIFVLMWVISNPGHAGDTVHTWITGVITFMQHLS